MPGKIEKPVHLAYFTARNGDGSVLHRGQTQPNQVTETGQETLEVYDDEAAFLTALGSWADQFPPLPAEGEALTEGDRYAHNGGVVQVRQSHTRTSHAPADVPALFLVAREPGTGIEWIAGENVALGTQRTYDGKMWQVIQGHVTQSDWQPPNVPALWEEVIVNDPNVWAPSIAVTVDDEYWYPDTDGTLYRCIQSHTTQAGWEPPNVPALWEPL